MDPRDLRVTKNSYFFTQTTYQAKQLSLMTSCDTTAEIGSVMGQDGTDVNVEILM